MNSKGDMEGRDVKKKTSGSLMRRDRSHSLGFINISKSDINKIIGVENVNTDKKEVFTQDRPTINNANDVGTSANKNTTDELGSATTVGSTIETEANVNDSSLSKGEDIFRPRKSIARTPTKEDSKDDPITQKRPRSETSPQEEARQKIRKQVQDVSVKTLKTSEINLESATQENNVEERTTTESMLQSITGALEFLYTLPKSDKLTESNLSDIKTAAFKIHTTVTNLAYKVGQLEKENYILHRKTLDLKFENDERHKIKPLEIQSTEELPERTYSSMLKLGRPESKSTSEKEKWTTPPQTKKYETLIKSRDESDTRPILKEIKKTLSANNESRETFKNVRHLKSGGVIVECQDISQQGILENVLKTRTDLQARRLENSDPMLMITGIEKGYDTDNFVKEFIEENPEIKTVFGDNVHEKLKVITRKPCRNQRKENWILQTNPNIFKWLIRNDHLSFDLTKVYIQEYTNLAMCFKCCYFGHVAKFCRGEPRCYKCGDRHESSKCPENSPLNCPNCKVLNLQERTHSVRDPKCPAFLQKINKLRQQTNYGTRNQQHFLEQQLEQQNQMR